MNHQLAFNCIDFARGKLVLNIYTIEIFDEFGERLFFEKKISVILTRFTWKLEFSKIEIIKTKSFVRIVYAENMRMLHVRSHDSQWVF